MTQFQFINMVAIGFFCFWAVGFIFNLLTLKHRMRGVGLWTHPFLFWQKDLLTEKGLRFRKIAIYIVSAGLIWLVLGMIAALAFYGQ